MKKTIEVKIEPPATPNFLRNVVTGRERAILIPIQDLTDDELREIGKEFVENLIESARKKRKHPEK